MAIDPSTQLAPNITAPSGSYPYGSSKNETAPGNNDGTPYNLTRADDLFGLQQALLQAAGIVPSGNPDTALNKTSSQYMQSLLYLLLAAFVFDDSGAADAYVLDVVSNNPAPASYEDNMTFEFIAGNTNTGASTVNVEGLGVKNIVLAGVALTAGLIVAGARIRIIFDFTNDRFELITLGNLGIATGASLTLTGAAPGPPAADTLYKESIMNAWINFDGTGVIAIRDSLNVSSIADNNPGDYTVNWDLDFADTNYCTTFGGDATSNPLISEEFSNRAVGSINIIAVRSSTVGATDPEYIGVMAMGAQ